MQIQGPATFWSFEARVLLRAAFDAGHYFGLTIRALITGVILVALGVSLHYKVRGAEATKTEMSTRLILDFAPAVLFLAGLFLFNLFRAPYLVYLEEYGNAQDRIGEANVNQKGAEDQRENLKAQLEVVRQELAKESKQKPPQTPLVTGGITQQGKNNITQVGGQGNKAIINPDVNPLADVVIYDFQGNKKVIRDGGTNVQAFVGGQQANFQKMQALYSEKDWPELRDFCEKQLVETPEWLTPALYGGAAYANLGNRQRAIELLSTVDEKSAGRPEYADAGRILKNLREHKP